MANIQEMFAYALETVPDAVRIRVRQEGEEIEVERGAVRAPSGDAAAVPASAPSVPPEAAGGVLVKAPLVGVFYAAPAPDAEPFVRVGSRVAKGDILCVIEAMKMFNEIESTAEGTVSKILAVNGNIVEFNQPLFEIAP